MDAKTMEILAEEMPYKRKIQSENKNKRKAICVAYIDARDVERRLDKAFSNWSDSYKIIKDDDRGVIVECTIKAEEQSRCDVWSAMFEKYQNSDNYDNLHKSAYSDAFKRAAVKRGIGRFIYDLDVKYVDTNEKGKPIDSNWKVIRNLTKHFSWSVNTKKKEKPWFNDKQYESMKSKMAVGTYKAPKTAEEMIKGIKTKYQMSKKMEEKIESLYSNKDKWKT